MTDKIPAAVDRALGELDEKIAAVDQSKEIAAVDGKVAATVEKQESLETRVVDHAESIESLREANEQLHERLDGLKAKIKHLFDHLAHILPPMKD